MDAAQPRYRALAWYPILAVGVSMVSFILVKTGRDAVFFGHGGLRELPLAYIWIAIASVPAAWLNLKAMERWGARRVRVGVQLVSALTMLSVVPWVAPENRLLLTVLFIMVPVLYAAVFATTWLLAGDLLEGAPRETIRWAYTWIGVASMLGGICGGFVAKGLAVFLGPAWLIAVGAAVLSVVSGLCVLGHRRHSPAGRPAAGADPLEAEPERPALLSQPYVRAMIGISVASSIIALFIDFQFYAMAATTGKGGMQFFANFYILLNICSMVLQLFVAPRLQDRFGIGGALMVLPGALLGGAGIVTFSTTVFSRSVLKVTEGGLKSSVFRSIWEQVFLQIDREQRGVAKTLVDGVFARVSEGVGAIALYAWILAHEDFETGQFSLAWISWCIVALAMVWIYCTQYLKKLGCAVTAENLETMIRLPDA